MENLVTWYWSLNGILSTYKLIITCTCRNNLTFLGDRVGRTKAKYTVSCLDIPGIQTAAKLPEKRFYEH